MPMPAHARVPLAAALVIAAVTGAGAAAFAYTAGWLSPDRLTPDKILDALAPNPALGHRRNHAKGICFTGTFEANGNGAEISRAPMLAAGTYPALGRFNLGTPDPDAADATVRVRGLSLQITSPDGAVWRAAMIDPPFFPVSTPEGFYELQKASKSKDPDAMRALALRHPEVTPFFAWASAAPYATSYAQNRFNSLDAFIATDKAGTARAVRWSYVPQAAATPVSAQALAALGPDYLETEIAARVAAAPQRWTLEFTLAAPGDPTNDPSKAWPDGRRTIAAGTLVVRATQPERDGPCRDINFDPTLLPDGLAVSDDPIPAARSAAYARSYDLRAAEAQAYPRHLDTGSAAR